MDDMWTTGWRGGSPGDGDDGTDCGLTGERSEIEIKVIVCQHAKISNCYETVVWRDVISVNIIITSQQGVASSAGAVSVRRLRVDLYLHNLHTVTSMVLLLSTANTQIMSNI